LGSRKEKVIFAKNISCQAEFVHVSLNEQNTGRHDPVIEQHFYIVFTPGLLVD
jgi:hypothetical protein